MSSELAQAKQAEIAALESQIGAIQKHLALLTGPEHTREWFDVNRQHDLVRKQLAVLKGELPKEKKKARKAFT